MHMHIMAPLPAHTQACYTKNVVPQAVFVDDACFPLAALPFIFITIVQEYIIVHRYHHYRFSVLTHAFPITRTLPLVCWC